MLVGPGGPVGTLQAEVDEDESESSFLSAISVRPGSRGMGLGRLILRRGLALTRRAGIGRARLSVSAENKNAVRLYRSQGFRDETVMVCYRLEVPEE